MISELPPTIAANIQYFTGRTWVLPKILDWLEHSKDRIFLLTGGPGTGKSMIMAWLSGSGPAPVDPDACSQLEQIRKSVAAAHFCVSASRNISPRSAAENMANQLTKSVDRFGDALASTLEGRVQILSTQSIGSVEAGATITGVYIGRIDLGALGDELSFDQAFSEPVKKLYENGYDEPLLLLVDALDEAQVYTGSINLVQLLAGLADLPAKVRLILSTRSDPRVLKYYRGVPGMDLLTEALSGTADVSAYVAGRLASEAPGLNNERRDVLARRIGEISEGVFLYGHVMVCDLLSHPSDIPDFEDYPLPRGLGKLYLDFLNRELGRDETRWSDTYRPLLGLIAVSRGSGLTRAQLNSFTGKDVEQSIRTCKQYLAGDLPEGPFRIFDRSFAEFLLEDPDNHDYHISAQEMHRKITDYYLGNFSKNWLNCDSYGLYHIIDHALASGMNDQERKITFDRILNDEFINAIQERTGWLYAFIEDLEALAKAEPIWAARLCFALVLERSPNSLVTQHALRLLAGLRQMTGTVGRPGVPREVSLDRIVQVLSNKDETILGQLIEMLASEKDARVRGLIALSMAETMKPEAAPCLLEIFKNEFTEASWAAADALIALNHRTIIPELVEWFFELKKNDRRSAARKQRILYVLGRMHAEEANELKSIAFTSSDPKIIGRAIDLTWLLMRDEKDKIFLIDQVQRILSSSPANSKELGPWADEWVQKRLVRALQILRVTESLPDLRRLQEHVLRRPAPKQSVGGAAKWDKSAMKRTRLVEVVEEAITYLQIGR